MSVNFDSPSVQSSNAADIHALWDNPASRDAPAPTCLAGPELVESSRLTADGEAVEIQGTAGGERLPAGSTPDGKTIERGLLHEGAEAEITREQTLADAGFGRTYVSSDQVVLTTNGSGNDDVQVAQRDDGTLDVSVNGEQYEVRLGEAQELTIRSGAGDDVINVAPNVTVNIVVDGGAGNDTITTGAGDDRIFGGEGDDTIDGGAGRDDIDGGRGNDILRGGAGPDVIYGGHGNDTIEGGAGVDYLDGGRGDDTIDGGEGQDIMSGGHGNDILRSGAGDDRVYTGEGNDVVENASGGDVVYAQEINDRISASTGAGNTVINVEIDSSVGSSIAIEGSDAFVERMQSEMDFLRASPVGQQMLAEFDAAAERKGNTVTIRELANEQNGYAQTFSGDANIRNGQAGAGGDVTISYNPSFHMDAFPAPIGVLYHEMSHAYNGVNGTFQPGTYVGEGPDSGRVPNAERQAVGLETSAEPFDFDNDPSTPATSSNPDHLTENGFREELGLPDRPSYAI